MLYYFSGTGNSKFVAQKLSKLLNEQLAEAGEVLQHEAFDCTLRHGERLGFVFPTYSWGPAPVILNLLAKLNLHKANPNTYCFMVTTCGDDVGLSANIFKKALTDKGIDLKAAFSVQMPNNYINLPGFDVDSDAVRMRKLSEAPARIEFIARHIARHETIIDVVPGKFAWFKSRIIRPLFLHVAVNDKKFVVKSNLCTHCGACIKNCPLHNISFNHAQEPSWHGNCTMCLSCLHRCPTHAIQYGNATQHKGRYRFPENSF